MEHEAQYTILSLIYLAYIFLVIFTSPRGCEICYNFVTPFLVSVTFDEYSRIFLWLWIKRIAKGWKLVNSGVSGVQAYSLTDFILEIYLFRDETRRALSFVVFRPHTKIHLYVFQTTLNQTNSLTPIQSSFSTSLSKVINFCFMIFQLW